MAAVTKTIVATGVSSGIGFEAIKQLLQQSQPYKVVLGARDTKATEDAYQGLQYDRNSRNVSILPLDLKDLKEVRSFAHETLARLGKDKIDYLLLNAAISDGTHLPGMRGSKWCETYIVNHLSQHYLIHLLREKLIESRSRIVVVSSGGIRNVSDPSVLETDLKTGSGLPGAKAYAEAKFVQLLGAHWWRRQLAGSCDVVVVSPGLIPGTGINRGSGYVFTMDMPDAKPVPTGAKSLLRAFTRSDFPEDPDRIFLTSWGEWWDRSVIEKSLDKKLQDDWCPSKDEIEEQEHVLD